MNPERWEQVSEILEQALPLETAQREAYLEQACAGDLELRGEVESLLASHEEAGSAFLKVPIASRGVAADHAAYSPVRGGHRIGPYLVEQEIGHGGMGEVFSAVRADGQYEKKVAVKLVRAGYDTAFVLERFRNERQILASLDHPNIARLLDGGTTDEGIPYLVMELVEGVPIDSYCDAKKLTVTARLQLFRQVCAAVQYAHQHLVIHRDIKPSNILVTQEGVPKLLDFGIAKILDSTGSAEVTVLRPMTPEYASPEQIRGETITTATDVYSLGVVLYQLLTGRSPYKVDTRSPQELSKAITDTDPEKPSTAILRPRAAPRQDTNEPDVANVLGDAREGSLARLHRRLVGDLDNIVLKALRKEPQRRYVSAEQFAEDLRRHLEARPVIARKDSWTYRSGKFVQRNKTGVAAALLVGTTLIAGVIMTLREARIAQRNQQRAEKRFDDVRKLSNSLIFEIHDSIQNLPGATPARKLLLDRAVEYLDKLSEDAGGDPDLQRELAWGYQRLAVVQGNTEESNLGDVNAALTSDRKALALFESVARANPKDAIDQLNVAMMHRILSFSELAEAGGREDLEKAMAITDRLLKTDSQNPKVRSERSIEFQNLAMMHEAHGDRQGALESFQKNLEGKEDILRTNPDYRGIKRSYAMATVQVGTALGQIDRYKDSLNMLDKGIERFEAAVKGGGSPDVQRELAIARYRKCDLQLREGDVAGAIASMSEAARTIVPLAKEDPENTMLRADLAGLDFQQGRILTVQKKYSQAVEMLQTGLKKFEASGVGAEEPPGRGAFHVWMGDAEMGRNHFAAALQLFDQAAQEMGVAPGKPIHDDYRCQWAEAYVKKGEALLKLGKLQEAAIAFEKSLEIAAPSLSPELRDVPAYYAAAEAYAGLGDVREAEAIRIQPLQGQRKLIGEARDSYAKSLEFWQKIGNPTRISPTGFLSKNPAEVSANLARCKEQLALQAQ